MIQPGLPSFKTLQFGQAPSPERKKIMDIHLKANNGEPLTTEEKEAFLKHIAQKQANSDRLTTTEQAFLNKQQSR